MISYIGGKYRMAKWIGEFIPNDIELYGEIFGGAFWTYLKGDIHKIKSLKEVHYNDFNRLMVNMFDCCKEHKTFVKHFENVKSQNSDLFISFRDKVINLENTKEIDTFNIPDYDLGYQYPYLLTQVFSGVGIKSNTKMQDLKGVYKSKFDSFRGRLEDPNFTVKLDKITKCHNLDFEKAVRLLDKESAFLYFDPPYYNTETYYSFHDFGRNDHLRLAKVMKNMKGLFALSYYEFDELKEWFPEYNPNEPEKGGYIWEKKDFAKARSAKKNVVQNKGTELLIMNYIINEDGSHTKIKQP